MVLEISILLENQAEPFRLSVDYHRVSNIRSASETGYPDWTKLSYHQCTNCPYSEKERTRCSPAVDMIPVVDYYSKNFSFEKATFIIRFNNIVVTEPCDLQTALRHIFLAIIFSSDCKIFSDIKRYILSYGFVPAGEHTAMRILSILLVEKFISDYSKNESEFKFTDIFEKIKTLGESIYAGLYGLFERIKRASQAEANINALVSALEAINLFQYTFEEEIEELAETLRGDSQSNLSRKNKKFEDDRCD